MFKKSLFSLVILSIFVLPLFANAQSAEDIARQITELQRQITVLRQQLAKLQGQSLGQWCYNFEKNLSVGASGKDIAALHKAIQKSGDPDRYLAESGTFAGDNAKDKYTEDTASAVSAFQLKYK